MQAEYVPTAVYLEFTFISTEELSFDPNQRHKARLASVLIIKCIFIVCFQVLLTRGFLRCTLKTTTLWAFRRCDFLLTLSCLRKFYVYIFALRKDGFKKIDGS